MLVAWLVAVTVTPGAAAPDESDTSPVTVASPVWPAAGAASASPEIATRLTRRTNWNTTRIGPSLPRFPGGRETRSCVGFTAKGASSLLADLRRGSPSVGRAFRPAQAGAEA